MALITSDRVDGQGEGTVQSFDASDGKHAVSFDRDPGRVAKQLLCAIPESGSDLQRTVSVFGAPSDVTPWKTMDIASLAPDQQLPSSQSLVYAVPPDSADQWRNFEISQYADDGEKVSRIFVKIPPIPHKSCAFLSYRSR